MSLPEFRPRYREDGSLDPQCLEEMGRYWLRSWLERRLSGLDPYFSIDKRRDEDPASWVVQILRDAGTAHPLVASLSYVALEMLEEARKSAAEPPLYFSSLLSICQQVYLSQTSPWFNEELAGLSKDPDAVEARWGGFDAVKEIVYAAMVQVPANLRNASHGSWLSLLWVPRYSTLALLGLGHSFEQMAPYLGIWWGTCPAEDRQHELGRLLFMALKDPGEERMRSVLRSESVDWPQDFREAINVALRSNGARELFSDHGQDQEERRKEHFLAVARDLKGFIALALESLPDRDYSLLLEAYELSRFGLRPRAGSLRLDPNSTAQRVALHRARLSFLKELDRLLVEATVALEKDRFFVQDLLSTVRSGDLEKALKRVSLH